MRSFARKPANVDNESRMTMDPTSLSEIYRQVFESLDRTREAPPVDVSFYPYVGINHTIRIRQGKLIVRVAEICREMPRVEHVALATILIAKLLRKRVPASARERYSSYIRSTEIRERAAVRKRERGRKIVSGAIGDVYDLDEIFDRLNKIYFRGSLPKPVLTWSTRRTYRILGHHDAAHDTIVVSRSLDDATVPLFVTEYIVFHEMLHIFHPTQHRDGRRYNHTPEFRRNERKFRHFDAADRWISENVGKLKRKARSRK